MKIPSTLKIGGHTVTVKVTPDVPNDNCGQFDIKKNQMLIHANQEPSQMEASLIHEILHALNITLSEEHVEFISQGIYQVLADNKLRFDK